jgi:hypothetical protein
MYNLIVSDEFLLWSVLCALWSFFSYAIASDPLPEDHGLAHFQWGLWRKTLVTRIFGIAVLGYLASHSIALSSWLAAITAIHPWIRFQSPLKWTAELEIAAAVSNALFMLAFVTRLHLHLHTFSLNIPDRQHLAAISILIAVLLFVVRGGTYFVRGFLRKAGTLPHLAPDKTLPAQSANPPQETHPPKRQSMPLHPSSASSTHEAERLGLDVLEINRGRLIGNLERLILAVVVAAGSYAALGFLVAAKGLIRSRELQERDFAEYFLVGSLASVFVALCAGLIIRFALLALWPELLSLQMAGG